MYIKNLISAIIVVFVVITSLTGCAKPHTIDKVITSLKTTMKTKFQYVSYEKGINKAGYDKIVYYFKDKKGVNFRVLSHLSDSSLGPITWNRCDYGCMLFDKQKDVVINAVQSHLPVKLIDARDYEGILIENGIQIEVSNFFELEEAVQLVERALLSIEPFPFVPQLVKKYSIDFDLPTVNVVIANNITILRHDFRCEGNMDKSINKDDLLVKLQERYLYRMREGDIEKEEIPYDIWERFPEHNIKIIYINDEKIDLVDFGFYKINSEDSIHDYDINRDRFFEKDGLFTQYVKQMGGDYNYNEVEDIKTWIINGDIWTLTRKPLEEETNSKNKDGIVRIYDEITKNGIIKLIPERLSTKYLEDLFGFEIQIDQEEPAIHIVSPLQ